MAGVAHAEHAAVRVAGGPRLVVRPQRGRAQRDRDRVVADQLVGDLGRERLVDLGRRLVDVVAPDDQPLVPRADHAHEAEADPADVRARLQHPVQDARAVRDVPGEVGVEDDVHRPRDVHLALHRQPDVLGDLRAPAVGADEVLRADLVALAGDAVLDRRRDAVGVLLEREVLGVEADPAAARRRGAGEDRLEEVLRRVVVERRAGEAVVGEPARVRAPGVQAGELLAGEARAEHGVAHELVRGRLGLDLGLQARCRA